MMVMKYQVGWLSMFLGALNWKWINLEPFSEVRGACFLQSISHELTTVPYPADSLLVAILTCIIPLNEDKHKSDTGKPQNEYKWEVFQVFSIYWTKLASHSFCFSLRIKYP